MENKKNNMKQVKLALLLVPVILAFIAGFIISRMTITAKDSEIHAQQTLEQMWTCSMHPQIQQPKSGKCPICFMDLIPVETGSDTMGAGSSQISFSPEAIKLMELQTTPVERKFVEAEIRLVGKIEYDETKLKHVTAWAGGRIDRLFVDFVGTEVIEGDHMVRLYSPELISAQAEYLQVLKSVENMLDNTSELIRKSNNATLKAAKEKLLLLGLTELQLKDIQSKGEPVDYLTIYAPVGGVVLERHVTEGAYVKTGTMIYTIADLSSIWVKLDAYESDVALVTYQQEVKFTTEAYPGETFKGRVTFIPPTLDPKTRTVKLRVNVPNSDGKLKPGMFVRAVVHSKLSQDGVVADPNLANKFVCPMHPSIIKDEPGICDICEMDLVKAPSRGIVTTDHAEKVPLVIPTSAPLITGKRAVVYVKTSETEKPTFEGREIVLGPRAGDYYIVKEGLSEGEIVVTRGNFKIDSALQIQAKPSMMSPDEATVPVQHQDTKEQTLCPVMGGAIDKKYFIEYQGEKVYFCCPGCDDIFLEEPEKYLDKLPQFKQKSIEQIHCPVMGGAINKKYFIEYQGKKVYFCCPGCEETFLKEPEKYMDKLPQFKNKNQ
jgi:Cu(I)/Ag(I) efflux system membrane fusion protein